MLKKMLLVALAAMLLLTLASCGSDDAVTFSGGSGVENDPYLIGTPADLWKLAELVNDEQTQDAYMSAWYKQTKDIDLGGKKEWMPIGYYSKNTDNYRFEGVYDGNGHTISGISINYKDPLAGKKRAAFGLFGELEGTVKNLTIANSSIKVDGEASVSVGAVAGKVWDGVIENCHTADSVTVVGTYNAGGICGYYKSNIALWSCTNKAAVTATSDVGTAAGIVAYGSCAIAECSNYGEIVSAGEAAGISGTAFGGIRDCSNYGSVQAASYAAGIVYRFEDGALNSSMNDATISIERCANYGDVTSTGKDYKGTILARSAGGIAASCRTGSVKDCVNAGTVTSGAESGGILAYFQHSSLGTPCEEFVVSGCANNGTVISTAGGNAAGGICGMVYGDKTNISFENCSNTGKVLGIADKGSFGLDNVAGGILGEGLYLSVLQITNCVNSGSVEGGNKAGGMVGKLNANRDENSYCYLADSSNLGSVCVINCSSYSRDIYVGGMVGYCKLLENDVNKGIVIVDFGNCINSGELFGDAEAVVYADDLCGNIGELDN